MQGTFLGKIKQLNYIDYVITLICFTDVVFNILYCIYSEIFLQLGVKIKLGVWSKKEINQLEKNMKMYLKVNGRNGCMHS